jgi:hypothetical protein
MLIGNRRPPRMRADWRMVIDAHRERDPLIPILDRAVWRALTAGRLDVVTRRVRAALLRDDTLRLAWEPVPIDTYRGLPREICSSWVFVLRAGTTTGAERHPNSIQRVMSFRGAADLQTWDGERWQSNRLHEGHALDDRWLTIPEHMWHRPVIAAAADWIVVSFHTATDAQLIEERPIDDDQPDETGSWDRYAGRAAR